MTSMKKKLLIFFCYLNLCVATSYASTSDILNIPENYERLETLRVSLRNTRFSCAQNRLKLKRHEWKHSEFYFHKEAVFDPRRCRKILVSFKLKIRNESSDIYRFSFNSEILVNLLFRDKDNGLIGQEYMTSNGKSAIVEKRGNEIVVLKPGKAITRNLSLTVDREEIYSMMRHSIVSLNKKREVLDARKIDMRVVFASGVEHVTVNRSVLWDKEVAAVEKAYVVIPTENFLKLKKNKVMIAR